MLERFHWQSLGGTTYRYPALGSKETEDWLNHIVPALMLLRTAVICSGRKFTKFTLDVHSSSGIDAASGFGRQPLNSTAVLNRTPKNDKFGEANLIDWLNSLTYPYRPDARHPGRKP